jgi:SAM-dependent methyltransferase
LLAEAVVSGERRDDLPAVVATNVERWGAEDDAWRGYHRKDDGSLVLDARVEAGLDLVLPKPGGAMLDVGCANGVLTRLFSKRAEVARTVGVDFVDMGLGPDIEFQKANLDTSEPLPFPDATFDVVTCMETLEHLHDTDHMVSQIRRVLRPDGYAIIAVPRLDAAVSIAMLAIGWQPPAIECSLKRRYGSPSGGERVSGHVSHFTRRALYELLRANHLSIDAFSQASIYNAWRYSQDRTPPAWQRMPMWVLSKLRVKQDELLFRVRPEGP